MKDKIQSAFNDIQSDEALIKKTTAFLQTRPIKRRAKNRLMRSHRLAGAFAALLILMAGLFGYQRFFYLVPAAYVGMDVNPSVELVLNRMDTVIEAVAYNDDGEALLQEIGVNGKHYHQAIAELIDQMARTGYFFDDAFVTVTVQAVDGTREQLLCDVLLQAVNGQMGSIQPEATVEVFPVTQEVRETANVCHMSAAKYLAIQALMEVDETATLEEYSHATL